MTFLRHNPIAAWGLLVTGSVAMVLGLALIVLFMFDQNSSDAKEAIRERTKCKVALRSIGAVHQKGNTFRLQIDVVENPRLILSDLSATILTCRHWTMHYFCLGLDCGDGSAISVKAVFRPTEEKA